MKNPLKVIARTVKKAVAVAIAVAVSGTGAFRDE